MVVHNLSDMTYIWSKFSDYQQCCASLVLPQQLREDSLQMFLQDEQTYRSCLEISFDCEGDSFEDDTQL